MPNSLLPGDSGPPDLGPSLIPPIYNGPGYYTNLGALNIGGTAGGYNSGGGSYGTQYWSGNNAVGGSLFGGPGGGNNPFAPGGGRYSAFNPYNPSGSVSAGVNPRTGGPSVELNPGGAQYGNVSGIGPMPWDDGSDPNYPAPGEGAPRERRSILPYFNPLTAAAREIRDAIGRARERERTRESMIGADGRPAPNPNAPPAPPPPGTRGANQYWDYGAGQLRTQHDVSGPLSGREFRLGMMGDQARNQPTNARAPDSVNRFQSGVWRQVPGSSEFEQVGERITGARSQSGRLINSPEGIEAYNQQMMSRQPFDWLNPPADPNTPSGPPMLPEYGGSMSPSPEIPPIFQTQTGQSDPLLMPPIFQDEYTTPMPPDWGGQWS